VVSRHSGGRHAIVVKEGRKEAIKRERERESQRQGSGVKRRGEESSREERRKHLAT